jgi:hypothetical protein
MPHVDAWLTMATLAVFAASAGARLIVEARRLRVERDIAQLLRMLAGRVGR